MSTVGREGARGPIKPSKLFTLCAHAVWPIEIEVVVDHGPTDREMIVFRYIVPAIEMCGPELLAMVQRLAAQECFAEFRSEAGALV
ncbi:MAG TPA: hypothetical protein VJS38_00820 [Phenylobacterium sp.]|uniref:hypothetical protein n=1 Tax=Phenylobacterium sp. TaxID=1871053 RepID=UPI002B4A01FC|nr:hypothetical protein [Phenylobacterium sp.]HKR86694.1 hypothetical protein [Phenylobacterium sp.]